MSPAAVSVATAAEPRPTDPLSRFLSGPSEDLLGQSSLVNYDEKEVSMNFLTVYGLVVGGISMSFSGACGNGTPVQMYDRSDSTPLILVQSETGAGSRTGPMGAGKSGTGKETDAGRGVMGKQSPFGSDQPTSGDFSPNSSSSTAKRPSAAETVDKTAGSNFPSGIGEQGTDENRSTTERTGGPQPSASESMKDASKHGEHKSEQAVKQLQEKQQAARYNDEVAKRDHETNSPPHLGPQGGSTADSGKARSGGERK
jgi:hypothetical protein